MKQVHRQIQWFPGHMNKTCRLIKQQLGRIDIVVEIVDARFPQSSRNPLLEEMVKGKPLLVILNKSDLADTEKTQKWIDFFNDKGLYAVHTNATLPKSLEGILHKCRKIVEDIRGKRGMKINVMIAGIPNVGKSTMINSLKRQKKTSVENKPGHTRDFQRVVVSNTLTLIDTPGILWHKFETEAGYKLAVLGSIKDSILDAGVVASVAIEMLVEKYPQSLIERYRLNVKDLSKKTDDIIELIGIKRGMLLKGGVVDFERVYNTIIHEIRGGVLGPMTLEEPN